MKAILLAAGLGTRLRPLTNSIPKCLVPINGEPLLGLWIKKLIALNVDEILINVHYFAEQVEHYVAQSPYRSRITLVKEESLLGTGGTLVANQDFWKGDTTLVIHADNYCEDTLTAMLQAHHQRPTHCDATLLLFETPQPQQCGIVELSDNGVIAAFHEKVANPPGNLASGALFIFSEHVFDKHLSHFSKGHFYEISIDFVPLLINKLYTYKTSGLYVDIGTPTAYTNLQSKLK
ncbi:nucleotidyltransferase family protein [Pseudoalteromonas sp. Of7M-16]|uniref:nucleotidyltransferase family protein n=1 Tax=Pseudoalteromonas sp. Of7M-16 TaxID=2917756 RepID=UPI001EF5009C|nr:nucleotidyltransferase family protein [Pseudoalteromonas sp. Of7M-16]MCG7549885.1 nucleotidyltransferase family protein [Pseudoalteromonas sp. Of7M-16]